MKMNPKLAIILIGGLHFFIIMLITISLMWLVFFIFDSQIFRTIFIILVLLTGAKHMWGHVNWIENKWKELT